MKVDILCDYDSEGKEGEFDEVVYDWCREYNCGAHVTYFEGVATIEDGVCVDFEGEVRDEDNDVVVPWHGEVTW
jgi:hypothetical protein